MIVLLTLLSLARAEGPIVSGTLTAAAPPQAAAVFVSIKAEGQPGPPLAAKRLPAGPFPLKFELTEADRPMANGPIPAKVVLKATLDLDGDPMSKSPGDLEIVQTVDLGATGLSLALVPRPPAP